MYEKLHKIGLGFEREYANAVSILSFQWKQTFIGPFFWDDGKRSHLNLNQTSRFIVYVVFSWIAIQLDEAADFMHVSLKL